MTWIPRKASDGLRRYNSWAGNPDGDKEDLLRCAVEVREKGGFYLGHQCQRPRGYGKKGLTCKQQDVVLG